MKHCETALKCGEQLTELCACNPCWHWHLTVVEADLFAPASLVHLRMQRRIPTTYEAPSAAYEALYAGYEALQEADLCVRWHQSHSIITSGGLGTMGFVVPAATVSVAYEALSAAVKRIS